MIFMTKWVISTYQIITKKINGVASALYTLSVSTVDSSSARPKMALGRAARRGWQAGRFPVFPLHFLFFLIFICEQCIDGFVLGNRTK